MNERIQELIRQSVVPADQAKDYALAKGLIEPTEKLDVAKFAELIVLECAELNFRELGLSGSSSFDVSRMIKQHFGVEE